MLAQSWPVNSSSCCSRKCLLRMILELHHPRLDLAHPIVLCSQWCYAAFSTFHQVWQLIGDLCMEIVI